MSSLKETEDFIALLLFSRINYDAEFLILYDLYKPSRPNSDLPYSSYPLFDLEDIENDECLPEFRFKKRDIPELAKALQIPDSCAIREAKPTGQVSPLHASETICFTLVGTVI